MLLPILTECIQILNKHLRSLLTLHLARFSKMRSKHHAAWLLASLGFAHSYTPVYEPVTYADSTGAGITVNEDHVLKLSSNGVTPSVIILDYGKDVEGYPTFNVTRRSGNTSIFEMSYSETRAMLDSHMVSLSL